MKEALYANKITHAFEKENKSEKTIAVFINFTQIQRASAFENKTSDDLNIANEVSVVISPEIAKVVFAEILKGLDERGA